MKSKGEKQLEELVTSVAEVQTELCRLRRIETAAKVLLDYLYLHAASSISRSRQAEALALASGWTPEAPPAPPAPSSPDPWARLPGQKYVVTNKVRTSDETFLKSGEIVEIISNSGSNSSYLRNLSTGKPVGGKWLLLDGYFRPATAEDLAKLAPAPVLAPAPPVLAPAPSPAGTLITNFADLRAGDKVRIEGRYCGTQVATLDKLCSAWARGVPYWIMAVHEGSQGADCLEETDFHRLKVYLLKRKPYVKDGRWVARVGDRFRSNADEDVVGTVNGFDSVGDATLEGHGAGGFLLLQSNWTPVEDA